MYLRMMKDTKGIGVVCEKTPSDVLMLLAMWQIDRYTAEKQDHP